MIQEKSEDRNGKNDEHAAESAIYLCPLFCGDNIDPLTVLSGQALFSVDPFVQCGETLPVVGGLFSCLQRRPGAFPAGVGRRRSISESGYRFTFLSVELTIQRVVLGRTHRCGRLRIVLCAPQPYLFLMQCVPSLQMLDQSAGLDSRADGYFCRVGGVGSSFVFLYHGL